MKYIGSASSDRVLAGIGLLLSHEVTASMHNFSPDSVIDYADLSASTQSWYFDAYLGDDLIGHHSFKLVEEKGELTVSIEAELNVRFMFFTVYSYKHQNTETWGNNCLLKMNSTTIDNGDQLFVNLVRDDGKNYIETNDSSFTNQSCVRSFAYWNPDLIKTNVLLNSQTGELVKISFKHIASEDFQLDNNVITAERYRIQG
ncbi:MAG: DUF6134 family protein, partial [Gammaproteobacteria bacterium]|nr:DUF6134 family protein [Gammaproteobacteria bacterium]